MPTPKLVCEACKEALDKGITHYTPNAGTLSFRQAIAEKSYLKDLTMTRTRRSSSPTQVWAR